VRSTAPCQFIANPLNSSDIWAETPQQSVFGKKNGLEESAQAAHLESAHCNPQRFNRQVAALSSGSSRRGAHARIGFRTYPETPWDFSKASVS
jgi:hypothetical protein